jgi:hypothetical protein
MPCAVELAKGSMTRTEINIKSDSVTVLNIIFLLSKLLSRGLLPREWSVRRVFFADRIHVV